MNKTLWFLLILSFVAGIILGYGYMSTICPTLEEAKLMRIENREMRKFINARCGTISPKTECTKGSCVPPDYYQRTGANSEF